MAENATETPKRKPGRPKGHPKTGGRRKGTPNRTRIEVLERINQEADPIGYLIRVARGLQLEAAVEVGATVKTKFYPTVDQQLDAAKILARKVLPDQKALELAPGGAEPFVFQFITPGQAGHA